MEVCPNPLKKYIVIGGRFQEEYLMLVYLFSRFVEFVFQSAILTGLIWILTKIQKMDQRFEYKFIWLAGAAAASTALNIILEVTLVPFLGIDLESYIAVPIVTLTLFLLIKKATGAEPIDILFTIVISEGIMFCVNLFILGSLMGDLRPSARDVDITDAEPPGQHQDAVIAPHPATIVKPSAPAPVPANRPSPAIPAAVTPAPEVPKPVAVDKYFSIKGVTRNGANSMILLKAAGKTHSLYLGDETQVETPEGPVSVRFSSVESNSVTLDISGTPTKFPIP